MTDTALHETVEARVRTLAAIVAEYDDPDEKLTILLGNFRRVVGERERFTVAAKAMLSALDAVESQVDIGSTSISEALWSARDGLRSVLWDLTS
jgi:hypothetical protein